MSDQRISLRLRAGGLLLAAAMASHAMGGSVVFVDDDAPGGGDGTSWNTAYRFLQDVLAGAAPGTEIRVAQGLYLPDHNEANPDGTGDREASFELNSGVTVFGGYAGIGAKDPDARDVELYETILSGDLLGDDIPGFVNFKDNSKNVVTASLFTDNTALIDGLTICCGFALNPDEGGGFHNLGGSPVIENCTFRTNFADTGGGGFFSTAQGSPTLHNCMFDDNFANGWGGGIWIQNGTAEIVGCTFVNNTGHRGGGLAVFGTGDFEIVDVLDSTFMANTATQGGGGIFAAGADNITISNCQFHENDAGSNPGGGGGLVTGGPATITDCDFVANTAFGSGGGLLIGALSGGETTEITNCSFVGNVAQQQDGGGVAIHNGGGSGVFRFDACTFVQNEAGDDGGGIQERFAALEVVRGLFVANSSNGTGGALELEEGNPVIVSSAFFGNAAGSVGGAVHDDEASPLMINCLISGNTSQVSGGALSSFLSNPVIINSSIVANQASDVGGGIRNFNGNPIIANSILWANQDSTGVNETSQITDLQGGVSTVYYSCIDGLTGDLGGVGNIGDDPLFVDSDGPDDIPGTEDDDLHLLSGSPCIDAADNTAVPKGIDTDLDGNPRFVDDPDTKDTGFGDPPIVDMGAYEFQVVSPCPADLDGSGDVGVKDLLFLLGTWGPCPKKGDCPADFDDSGDVGVKDLLFLLGAWGPCP